MTAILRSTHLLNGLWDFAFLGKIDLETFDPAALPPTQLMPVPSAFDALPDYAGQRGAAAYRTTVVVPEGRRGRIKFGAVSLWSRVFADGVLLRENACGYAPFSVDLPVSKGAPVELLMLVDNRFDFERVPMHEEVFDFYQYGGILRDVVLEDWPAGGGFIEHVQVTPTREGYRDGKVEITITLGGKLAEETILSLSFDGGEPSSQSLPTPYEAVVIKTRVSRPRVWSPTTPNLHRLEVVLRDAEGRIADGVSVRFGLRSIEAREGALWLNGEKLQLRGYNRHEWHPNYGPCTPYLQMVADLQLLRDLGCNFIRGSHYPQDQRFLDLCDEFGFLFWEENLGWGQREKTFASAKWRRDHAESLQAMVKTSCNHPCIIMWGFLNEAGTKADYVREVFEETAAQLRRLDPSRLVTYATMFALEDKCYDLADIISINIYPGWYNCEGVENPLALIAPKMQQCFDSIDERGFTAKPVMVSEIGAEGLYGWHDAHRDFYTEEYQAEYLRTASEAALNHPRCSGIALWHFSDARTYGGGWSMRRPRTFNNKGTLDEYRRPKLAYAAVRKVFTSHQQQDSQRARP